MKTFSQLKRKKNSWPELGPRMLSGIEIRRGRRQSSTSVPEKPQSKPTRQDDLLRTPILLPADFCTAALCGRLALRIAHDQFFPKSGGASSGDIRLIESGFWSFTRSSSANDFCRMASGAVADREKLSLHGCQNASFDCAEAGRAATIVK